MLAKKFIFFPYNGSSSAYLSLTSFKTILLDCIVIAIMSACIKNIKMSEFLANILILKIEESMQHFGYYVLLFQER